MEQVLENCEALADTGMNQLLLVLGALLIVALAGAFLMTGRKHKLKFVIAAFGILFGFSLMLAPVVGYAQSASDDCVEQNADDDDEDPVVALSLTNDSGTMQLPDVGNPTTNYYLALLANDNAPSGDVFDAETIDLDPNQDGIQENIDIVHPDDADYNCDSIGLNEFGILVVSLNYECYDDEFNVLNLTDDFTIPSFEYVVTTQNAVTATTPATVTIDVASDPGYIVSTVYDDLACEVSQTVDILANDSTSIGSLDPDTIDLNPNLPGIQQTYSYTQDILGDLYEFTATVNEDGDIIVESDFSTESKQFFYTVQNTNGDISIVTLINGGSCT